MIADKIMRILGKWLLFVLFVILSVLNFVRIDSVSHSASDTLRPFLIQTAALALILFLIFKIFQKIKVSPDK
jgi:hypothetical protein